MICFHFTTFAVLETAEITETPEESPVVICFHFTTFAVLETARWCIWGCLRELWFAFILLPLPYWKQRLRGWRGHCDRCDLLSFYYLCRTGNSAHALWILFLAVVICFHFTTFAVLETARAKVLSVRPWLWFAFILLPLPYWKQRSTRVSATAAVVICFHFTTFAVLETA